MSNNEIASRARAAINAATKPGTMAGLKTAEVEALLAPYKLAIQNALPNGGSPSRIIQSAVFQIKTKPKLAECSLESVIGCVLNAALLGLNPALKQCHFVPRFNKHKKMMEACFQFDYRGLVTLARRSSMVLDVFAKVVRKTDKFDVQYGSDKRIVHIPDITDESEDFTAVYAVIRYVNGGHEFLVLTPKQVEKRRLTSSNQEGEPTDIWLKWKEEMWAKTALRRLLETAPLSDEQAAALQTEGLAVTPAAFQRGELRAEMIAYSDEDGTAVVVEATDLQSIRDGVQDCNDMDALNAFWKQGADEWSGRADVIEIFAQRRKELEQ